MQQLAAVINVWVCVAQRDLSVAQAGSNYDEKNWRSKISLDCPFKEGSVQVYLTLHFCQILKLKGIVGRDIHRFNCSISCRKGSLCNTVSK